jgi:hypothetical protein
MNSPFNIWLAGVLGWSEVGFVVILETVIVIFGSFFVYMFVFTSLSRLAHWLVGEFRGERGTGKVVVFFPMMVVCTAVLILEIINTLLFMWAGYETMKSVRDWWHKGAR